MMSELHPMPARRPAPPKTYPVCSLEDAMKTIRSKCGGVRIRERHGKGPNKVILLPEATRELDVMVSYGRRSPMNVNEQKYAGYGHFLTDGNGHTITIVKHFIEIQTMNRTASHASNLGPNGEKNPGLDFLEYHRKEFFETEAKYNTDAFGFQVDPFLGLCGASQFVLEGHTHLDIGVFYSGPDRASGAARAASTPLCIFVCDPIKKKMLGSIGKDFAAAEVIVYDRGGSVPELPGRAPQQPASPVDEIMRLARQCITCGCGGKIRFRPRRTGGRACLRLKLTVPRDRKD